MVHVETARPKLKVRHAEALVKAMLGGAEEVTLILHPSGEVGVSVTGATNRVQLLQVEAESALRDIRRKYDVIAN